MHDDVTGINTKPTQVKPCPPATSCTPPSKTDTNTHLVALLLVFVESSLLLLPLLSSEGQLRVLTITVLLISLGCKPGCVCVCGGGGLKRRGEGGRGGGREGLRHGGHICNLSDYVGCRLERCADHGRHVSECGAGCTLHPRTSPNTSQACGVCSKGSGRPQQDQLLHPDPDMSQAHCAWISRHVIAPNPTFMRYHDSLAPELGHQG
jgi:hypothetical protein